ncbi:hypothetical protein PPERSA_01676 [Pseudocohnilembus persalinus]|uniref:Uncharacterized protein n=1 Tax=Pseudocohnilembus persalinus TaxID=266149 RepID=A0A0V0R0W4_PSEPJ|nr:hypothetical protein PPERSA_01676 [Pseudocohnilembus persalinus]|eukprot:KRX08131.1 hypothetical protein PPERSA_01676 [Pseudocohnilembus persalinus]
MSHQELKCLLIIFEKIKKGILEVKDNFSSMNDQLQTSKEGINYLKDQFENQMDDQEILFEIKTICKFLGQQQTHCQYATIQALDQGNILSFQRPFEQIYLYAQITNKIEKHMGGQ